MTDQNPQRFSTFIAEHRAGLADADLTSAMQEVAHRCALTGKPGVVTLQIKVSPKGDMLSIVDTLAVKLPAPPAEERLYWIGSDGSLTRSLDDVLADAVAGEVDRIRAEFPGVPVVYGTPG